MILTFDEKGYIRASIQGRNGHTTQTSIMELVQNSVDARATEIRINYDTTNNRIFIIDNGLGMNYYTLKKMAVLYKHEDRKENTHGKFGIGAKDAWFQIGGNWNILSKTKNNNNIVSLEWNVDGLIKWADNKTEYDNFIDSSKNATEDMKKLYDEYKINSESGTLIMCKLPEEYIDNDFKKTLTKLVKDIQIKHQNKRCEILYNFDGTTVEYTKIENYDWLYYEKVPQNRKVQAKIYLIPQKNQIRTYYLYYINFNEQTYKYTKGTKHFEIEKNLGKKIKNGNFHTITLSITFLDDETIKQQMKIKYGAKHTTTELYNLSGILINRNNHYVYTDTRSWPLKCIGKTLDSFLSVNQYNKVKKGFRCELKYDANFLTQKIDDVFGIKANKSNFIYDHVDSKFKDMMDLLTSGLMKHLKKNGFEQDGLQNSLIGILEEYENVKKEEKRKQKEEEQRKKQKEKEAIEKKLKRESQKKQNEEKKKREKKEKAEKLEREKKEKAEKLEREKKENEERKKREKKENEERLKREEEQRLHQEELAELARQNAEKIAKLKKEKEAEIAKILKEERERAKQEQEQEQEQEQFELIEVSDDDSISSNASEVETDTIPNFLDIFEEQNIKYKVKGDNLIFEPCNLTQLKNVTNQIFKQQNINDKIIPDSEHYLESLYNLFQD